VGLLFYHCRLHRYVVFEWKLGRFEREHVGKLNFETLAAYCERIIDSGH